MDKDQAIEEWKDITGWEGYYQVSNIGNVRSLTCMTNHNYGGVKKKKGQPVKPIKQTTGYLSVNLSVKGHRKTVLVHRLVAVVFINNNENKPAVNHKNGVKLDNRIGNLEWVTYSENERHSYSILGKVNPRRKAVKQIDVITGVVIGVFNSGHDAANSLGLNDKNISAALTGKTKSCGGYKWEFA